ncbi:hypothetical protein [Campylobacter sp.]|nr:hypothetical protein [Campylobacter sp.]MDO4674026.1 hypothetical protein [Campylobacter sp.]
MLENPVPTSLIVGTIVVVLALSALAIFAIKKLKEKE